MATKVITKNGQFIIVNTVAELRRLHDAGDIEDLEFAGASFDMLVEGGMSREEASASVKANVPAAADIDFIGGNVPYGQAADAGAADAVDGVDRLDGISRRDPTIPLRPTRVEEPYIQPEAGYMPLPVSRAAREQALAEPNWQAFNRFMTQTAGGMTPLARGYLQRQYDPLRMGYLSDPTISPYTTFSDFLQSGRAPLGPQGGIERLGQIQDLMSTPYTEEQMAFARESMQPGYNPIDPVTGEERRMMSRGPQLAAMFGGPQGQQLAFDVALQPMLSQIAPSFRGSFEQAAGDVFNRFLNQTPQKSFMDQLVAQGGIFGPTVPQTTGIFS